MLAKTKLKKICEILKTNLFSLSFFFFKIAVNCYVLFQKCIQENEFYKLSFTKFFMNILNNFAQNFSQHIANSILFK